MGIDVNDFVIIGEAQQLKEKGLIYLCKLRPIIKGITILRLSASFSGLVNFLMMIEKFGMNMTKTTWELMIFLLL